MSYDVGDFFIYEIYTFANVRLVNKMADRTGNWTKHVPSGE